MNLPGYDQWLEQPYIDRDREQAAFESFCDAMSIETGHLLVADEAWSMYEDWLADPGNYGPDPDQQRDEALDREVW